MTSNNLRHLQQLVVSRQLVTKQSFSLISSSSSSLHQNHAATASYRKNKIVYYSTRKQQQQSSSSLVLCSFQNSNNNYVLSNTSSRRNLLTRTIPLLEKQTMKVPTMGDSITEGTIVEWTAQIGQAVADGDVVALIETDKVTVEIKATKAGVVTQQFGKVDDTVEVGADLYELDTEGVATVVASSDGPISKEATTTPSSVVQETATPEAEAKGNSETTIVETTTHRHPSIRFLGRNGWAQVKNGTTPSSGKETTTPTNPTTIAPPSKGTTTTSVIYDDSIIHPMYGRPKFTEEEMEALLMGGASIAPQIVRYSTGVEFKPLLK